MTAYTWCPDPSTGPVHQPGRAFEAVLPLRRQTGVRDLGGDVLRRVEVGRGEQRRGRTAASGVEAHALGEGVVQPREPVDRGGDHEASGPQHPARLGQGPYSVRALGQDRAEEQHDVHGRVRRVEGAGVPVPCPHTGQPGRPLDVPGGPGRGVPPRGATRRTPGCAPVPDGWSSGVPRTSCASSCRPLRRGSRTWVAAAASTRAEPSRSPLRAGRRLPRPAPGPSRMAGAGRRG